MRQLVTLALLTLLALPAAAAVVHDEGVDGDLGTDPAAPTALAFGVGGNTVIGTVATSGAPTGDRDYITFTVAPGTVLVDINLLSLDPDNLAFAALNAGTTSFVPSAATAASFLSGIHPSQADVGTDLLLAFVSSSVVPNSLAVPELGPGDYCFMIQQTSPITQSYSVEFVVQSTVSTETASWGAVKSLY